MNGNPPGSTPVIPTLATATRTAAAVRWVESIAGGVGNGGRPPLPPATGDDPPIYLGKTALAWAKGSIQLIEVWAGPAGYETATGFSVFAMNRFAAIGSGKWVLLAGPNQSGVYYLCAGEC